MPVIPEESKTTVIDVAVDDCNIGIVGAWDGAAPLLFVWITADETDLTEPDELVATDWKI